MVGVQQGLAGTLLMAITNFEAKNLKLANKLIDKYGQVMLVMSKSSTLRDINKKWLGIIPIYSPISVKAVNRQLVDNLLNVNDGRVNNLNTGLIIAGDALTDLTSNDLIFSFNGLISEPITLNTITIPSSNFIYDIATSGNYIVNTSTTIANISLNVSISNNSILMINRADSINDIVITPTSGFTIENKNALTISKNSSLTGLILNGTNYSIVERLSTYGINKIAPSGNTLLYSLEVGA